MTKEEVEKEIATILVYLGNELDRYFEHTSVDEDGNIQQTFGKKRVGPGEIKDWKITINPTEKEHGVPHFHAKSVQRDLGVSFTLDGKCEPCDGDVNKISGKDVKLIKAFYEEYKADFDKVYALMSPPKTKIA